jgi:hypothetical protein
MGGDFRLFCDFWRHFGIYNFWNWAIRWPVGHFMVVSTSTSAVAQAARLQALGDYDHSREKARIAGEAALPPCEPKDVDASVRACHTASDHRNALASAERRESEAQAELAQAKRELERL